MDRGRHPISERHVPNEIYEFARQHFDEKELVDLTLAIIAINGWNRLAISFRKEPGSYHPKIQSKASSESAQTDGSLRTAASTPVAGSNKKDNEHDSIEKSL